LLEADERQQAIEQCLKFLKKGGILIVSFISAYAPLLDCLIKFPQAVGEFKDSLIKYLDDGRHYSDERDGFTDAYFFNPAFIGRFMSQFDLETIKVMAVEGPGGMFEGNLMQLREEDFQSWLDIFETISENPETWGISHHFLYIGKKR
jgi:SAM-dependent methyltransferase